jgi:hypothetical protein
VALDRVVRFLLQREVTMRNRTKVRQYHPSFDVLEHRDVPSSVASPTSVLQFLEHLPTPVLHEALTFRTGVADRSAGADHHRATGGHHHHSLGLLGLIEGKKKQPPKFVMGPPGPQGPQGPQGPVGPQGPAGPSGWVRPFNLGAFGSSDPITVPAETPVFIIATTTTPGNHQIGFISLVRVAGTDLEWAGVGSTNDTPGLAGGTSNTGGNDILNFGFNGQVALQTVGTDQFKVANFGANNQTGFVWILPAPV